MTVPRTVLARMPKVEMCPSCNVQLGVVANLGDHPARSILTSLSSPTYALRDPRFAAMLRHGTQHLPKGWADSGIMFGGYYFIEALGRYEKAGSSTAAFMSD